ncbi:MAG: MBL fold metallo-hydrolase [Candidatus Pacebacteria bacterium]|nr:MBL fold metallo-hydrolase [Candidatus Paceibacterota bacterium]
MNKKGLFVLLFLFLLNFFAWKEVFILNRPVFLEVDFFDVGQGDATFIKTPLNHRILIDGGPDSFILEKLSENIPFYDRTIDLIILTHPHSDHLRGLISVFESYDVKNLIWNGVIEDADDFRKWEKAIEGRENVFIAKSGIRVRSGEVFFDILYPFQFLKGQSFKDSNNTSIVIRINHKENAFLFTGDNYKNIEFELIALQKDCEGKESLFCKNMTLNSNVLQAGHHGSKTSTSEEFLFAVSPQFVVISSGKNNSYGHPNQEVLANLNNFGISVLRTDELGDIKIVSDGKIIKVVD